MKMKVCGAGGLFLAIRCVDRLKCLGSLLTGFLKVVLMLGAGSGVLHAQPSQPLKIVVPYVAGGVTDQAARVLAERMAVLLGKPVIVENRPGAGSRLGTLAVAQAPADGAVLLFSNISFSTLALVDKTAPFDPQTSFTPVGLAAVYGAAVVVKASLPVSTLQELTAYARQRPGQLSYGSAGVGSGAHFVGEYYKALTGTFIVHVPYRSTSAALNEVAGGQLDLTFDATAKPLVDAGKVKALAIVGNQRDPRMPNVPTAAEAGVKGLDFNAWLGLLAPAGTPVAVVEQLNRTMNAALQDDSVRKRYAGMGLVVRGGAPDELSRQLREDAVLYRRVIAEARMKLTQD